MKKQIEAELAAIEKAATQKIRIAPEIDVSPQVNTAVNRIEEAKRQINDALSAIKTQVDISFKTGAAPGEEQFQRLAELLREMEITARTTFGVDIPEGVRTALESGRDLADQLANAAGVDFSEAMEKLKPILQEAGDAAKEFGVIWDATTGEVLGSIDDLKNRLSTIPEEANDLTGVLQEWTQEAKNLPDITERFATASKTAEGTFQIISDQSRIILTNLSATEKVIRRINQMGGAHVYGQ
jgi:methyl-accepting chemotaxis protein